MVARFWSPFLLVVLGCVLVSASAANEAPALAPEPASAPAATSAPEPLRLRDELLYPDGDRVFGELVRRDGEVIIFRSTRFGELRVKESEAKLVLAKRPSANLAKSGSGPAVAGGDEDETDDNLPWWYQLGPWHLTRYLGTVFGSWHGRLAMSTEVVADANDRSAFSVQGSLRRKWKRDEAKIALRYDYAETNNLTTSDVLKGDATWNHAFGRKWYSIYHPTVEWNRAFKKSGTFSRYLLLQQEIGVGLKVYNRARGKLSVGLAQNIFDVWTTFPTPQHVSRGQLSGFAETEWKLPWQITLSDRGILYFSSNAPGWENRFQIDKKLTETLSIGLNHELRYNNPDVRVSDYSKLKLMLGLDF